MISFRPLRQEQFESYVQQRSESYAAECVQSRFWKTERAVERAQNYIRTLLPLGTDTPNNQIVEIIESDQIVGVLWFVIHDQMGEPSIWVHHIEIYPEFRRRGYAKQALAKLEQVAKSNDIASIGLHVFAFNSEAQALYQSLGYSVPGINMIKRLRKITQG